MKRSLGIILINTSISITLLFLVNFSFVNSEYRRIILSDNVLVIDKVEEYLYESKMKNIPNLDVFSECVALSAGVMSEGNIIRDTLLLRSIMTCDYLHNFSEKNISESTAKNYGRFWGGYELFTKTIIILFGDINALTLINLILFVGLLGLLTILSIKKFGILGLALTLPVLSSQNLNPFLLVSHSLSYIIPMILCILIIRRYSNLNNLKKLSTSTLFLFGFYFGFFNMLMYPILIFSLPLALLYLIHLKYNLSYKNFLVSWAKIHFITSLGLLFSFALKFFIDKILGLGLYSNSMDSIYWEFSVNFSESITNMLWTSNIPVIIIMVLIFLNMPINSNILKNLIFLILIFVPSLSYNIFIPEHTVHLFSVGSSYAMIYSGSLFLAMMIKIFIRESKKVLSN